MIDKSQTYLAICGIIAPLLFTIQLIIIGFYHPSYNHITQYMSELGAINAPYASIKNTGLSIVGILMMLFSYSLYKEIDDKKKIIKIVGPTLVAISGLSFFLIGFFPCDPDCINTSTTGIIHGYLANTAQFPLMIAPLLLYSIFKRDKKWNNILYYSIITSVFGIVFFIIYKSYFFDLYIGLFQRISFGIPILWIEIIAIKIYRLNYSNS
jgi:hypothetical membrane protein